MSQSTFPLFPELAPELRDKIWKFAIAAHLPDTASLLPYEFITPGADYRRQAIVASFPEKDRSPLYVHIRDPYDGLKVQFEDNEFESFVDSFPISPVCRETRANVTEFCRLITSHVLFEYNTSPLRSFKPPERGAQPVVLRSPRCRPGAETLEQVFPKPKKLTITAGQFKSAEHLVGMLFRFFGNKIQRLVMSLENNKGEPVERAYWSGSGAAPTSIEVVSNHGSQSDPATVCVTKDQKMDVSERFLQDLRNSIGTLNYGSEENPIVIHVTKNRKLRVPESFWRNEKQPATNMTTHLLKIYEVFDASLGRLPHLKHIAVNLEVDGTDGYQEARLATSWEQKDVAE